MKRSFVPAGLFVLILLVAAVGMKQYVKYEYATTMNGFLQAEAVYTITDGRDEKTYTLADPEIRVALAGFLRENLALDRSVNGDPERGGQSDDVITVTAQGGGTLVVFRSHETQDYIRGRFFTHYFLGDQSVVDYLDELIQSLGRAA